MTLVVCPEDASAADPAVTGTKSALLAQLARWPSPDRPRLASQATVGTEAWWLVADAAGLRHAVIAALAGDVDAAAEMAAGLARVPLPAAVRAALDEVVRHLGAGPYAVRSSAVAEDLADQTYAGQYVSELGVAADGLAEAYRACLVSAWSPGVQAYRRGSGPGAPPQESSAAMAVLVQPMVHDGEGWAGAALSDGVGGVTVEVVRGWGDELMSGRADPLRWSVAAGDSAGATLADAVVDWVRRAERRLGHAVEVEFALGNGETTPVVLQLRPHRPAGPVPIDAQRFDASLGEVRGAAVGRGTVVGPVCALDDPAELDRLRPGGVLVTSVTDPRWVPLLHEVAAVVTDHGGLTSHAAIVCREMGLLAVVGCGDATVRLAAARQVEVRCEGANGWVRTLS